MQCPCTPCTKTYKNTPSDRILLAHHKYRCRYNKKSKNLKCPKCNSTFLNRDTLNKHINAKICEVGNYECEKCKKTFSNRDKLTYHKWMSCEHRTTYKEYECINNCGKVFNNARTRTNHSAYRCPLRTTNLQFTCKYCNETISTSYELYQDHMMYQCTKNENRILCKCTKCGLTLSNFGNLERHMNDSRCKEVDVDFEFDGLISELRSRANVKHVKNYIYLISDGNAFFKNGEKLEDYVGTGTYFRFLSHLIVAYWPGQVMHSPKLDFIRRAKDLRISLVFLQLHTACFFVEANLIVRYFKYITNQRKEIAKSTILDITDVQREQMIEESIGAFERILNGDQYLSIPIDLIIEVIEVLGLDTELEFPRTIDLEEYVSNAVRNRAQLVNKVFRKYCPDFLRFF